MKDGTPFTDQNDYDKEHFHEEMQNRAPRLDQTVHTPGYTRIGGNAVLAPVRFNRYGISNDKNSHGNSV